MIIMIVSIFFYDIIKSMNKSILYEETDIKDQNILRCLKDNDILLDIETTGLSRFKSKIFLLGFGLVKEKPDGNFSLSIKQIFSVDGDEEGLLTDFISYLPKEGRIITYNGDRFDIPFIEEKCRKYSLPSALSDHESLDLLKYYSKLKNFLRLPSMSEKTVESFLKIKRDDKLSGKEIAEGIRKYYKEPDKITRDLILLHNKEDIEGLVSVFKLSEYLDLEKAFINIEELKILSSSDKEMNVSFYGKLRRTLPSAIRIIAYPFYLISEDNSLRGTLRLRKKKLRFYHPDIENYTYLVKENIVIPKILADDIPRSRKRKPKKSECFTETEGFSMELPNKVKEDFILNAKESGILIFKDIEEEYNGEKDYVKINKKDDIIKNLNIIIPLLLRM